jgi:glycosyltransferase involved in cell wall biosynthesis
MSVLGQSSDDYEVIVVDDHSGDDTLEVIERLRDKRVRCITRSQRGGGAAARNTGIEAASGEFIAFLDDDDAWHDSKLKSQVEVMQRRPEVGLVYTGAVHIHQHNGQIFKTVVPRYRGYIFQTLLEHNVIGTTSSVMVRKEALRAVGGFDETFPSCQDWDLYLRLAKDWAVDFVGEALVDFYLHPVRITRNDSARIDGRKMILEKFSSYINGDKRILSKHHGAIGRLCCQAGRYREGRHLLLQAVRESPTNATAIKHLLPVLFGGEGYRRLMMFQRRCMDLMANRKSSSPQKKGQLPDE